MTPTGTRIVMCGLSCVLHAFLAVVQLACAPFASHRDVPGAGMLTSVKEFLASRNSTRAFEVAYHAFSIQDATSAAPTNFGWIEQFDTPTVVSQQVARLECTAFTPIVYAAQLPAASSSADAYPSMWPDKCPKKYAKQVKAGLSAAKLSADRRKSDARAQQPFHNGERAALVDLERSLGFVPSSSREVESAGCAVRDAVLARLGKLNQIVATRADSENGYEHWPHGSFD